MVAGQNRVFGCAANLLRGKKCVFCGSFQVNRTRRGYVSVKWTPLSRQMSSEFKLRPSLQSQRSSAALF
jgi:hypothetical protein